MKPTLPSMGALQTLLTSQVTPAVAFVDNKLININIIEIEF